MFEFRVEGAYDAEKLLTANWPTCAVTVIQRGAEWQSWGPNHLVVPMSDVGDPKASPDANHPASGGYSGAHCEPDVG